MPDYLTVCEERSVGPGATLLEWMGKTSVRYKGRADLVTEADLASQELIRKIVLGAFPEHSLLGEEDAPGQRQRRTEFRWIADPLDGTTNYVHGVPHFTVSWPWSATAARWSGPSTTPVWTSASRRPPGEGAHLNGRPLHVSKVTAWAMPWPAPVFRRGEARFARPAGLQGGGVALPVGPPHGLGVVEPLLTWRRAVST